MIARLDIDRQNDLLYIGLSPEGLPIDRPVKVAYSKRLGQDLVLDFDKEDRLVGIELLAASKFIGISELEQLNEQSFVGVKEAAELLSIEKSNFVRDYANKADFPKPLVDVASGRIWLKSEIQRYIHEHRHPATSGNPYIELFKAIHSTAFPDLRPAQTQTLDLYYKNFEACPDIAIELPTGSGKSLIALLIAEYWRRLGKRAAILTGNKTLARQMEDEGRSLGVKVVRMEGKGSSIPAADKRQYHRSVAIAVMNYWVYFNQNPVIDPADLLIIDDAHLAEHCLHSLYSVEIKRFEHKSLFESLVTELASRFPEYAVLQDALDDQLPASANTELFSYLDQSAAIARIKEIVDASPELESDDSFRFQWVRLRDRLEQTNVYLSGRSIWFRPYAYPLSTNKHYETVEQRIYMSATIGDTADLQRRLGSKEIEKVTTSLEHQSHTYGRRMLVLNRLEDEDLPIRLQHAIHAALQVHPKSVWLCSSESEAKSLSASVSEWLNNNGMVGHPIWQLTSLGNEIDEFKAAPKGHLFVAGRFDGMDFKGDECRIVVFATLPKAINLQEEFVSAHLRDASFMLRRLNQRIIQGLGRCNRDSDDYAVYFLADKRFATHFGRDSQRLGLPANILAEIDMAEDQTDTDVTQLARQIKQFLKGKFSEFDAALKGYRGEVNAMKTPTTPGATDSSIHEVEGWTELFEHLNYQAAADEFAASTGDNLRRGNKEVAAFFQYCRAKALFLKGNQGDSRALTESLDVLNAAIETGGKSSWFNRLRTSLYRYRHTKHSERYVPLDYSEVVLHSFDDHLEGVGRTGTRFDKWNQRLIAELTSKKHREYQEGLQKLGLLLGFAAARPRYGASTDCFWRGVFGNVRELVTWEAKIEDLPTSKITAKDVGQAHVQLARAFQQYGPKGFTVRGTLVTHILDIETSAKSSLGEIRIVRSDAVLALCEHFLRLLSIYRGEWSLEDITARQIAYELIMPKLPQAGWLTRALEQGDPFVKAEYLLGEWPK